MNVELLDTIIGDMLKTAFCQRESGQDHNPGIIEDFARRLAALNKTGMSLPCGHHESLAINSAETGKFLYCELCDERSGRKDAEKMEAQYQLRIHNSVPEKVGENMYIITEAQMHYMMGCVEKYEQGPNNVKFIEQPMFPTNEIVPREWYAYYDDSPMAHCMKLSTTQVIDNESGKYIKVREVLS